MEFQKRGDGSQKCGIGFQKDIKGFQKCGILESATLFRSDATILGSLSNLAYIWLNQKYKNKFMDFIVILGAFSIKTNCKLHIFSL